MSEPTIGPYVTMNWHKHPKEACFNCTFRLPDSRHEGWGWCKLRRAASVSPTGGCDEWAKDDPYRSPGPGSSIANWITDPKILPLRNRPVLTVAHGKITHWPRTCPHDGVLPLGAWAWCYAPELPKENHE